VQGSRPLRAAREGRLWALGPHNPSPLGSQGQARRLASFVAMASEEVKAKAGFLCCCLLHTRKRCAASPSLPFCLAAFFCPGERERESEARAGSPSQRARAVVQIMANPALHRLGQLFHQHHFELRYGLSPVRVRGATR
jgi:hypothetical protein